MGKEESEPCRRSGSRDRRWAHGEGIPGGICREEGAVRCGKVGSGWGSVGVGGSMRGRWFQGRVRLTGVGAGPVGGARRVWWVRLGVCVCVCWVKWVGQWGVG